MSFAAWKGVDGRVKHGHDDERSGRLSQLEPLAGQQLPIAVLLLPDLQCTDLDTGGLAVGLHFSFEQMARDGSIADYRDAEFGKSERLDNRLARHDPIHELRFCLNLAARMAIAQLVGRKLLQFPLVR